MKHFFILICFAGLETGSVPEMVATSAEDRPATEWYAPPPSTFKMLKKQDNLTTFVKLLEATGLDEILDGKGTFTVFAPTDQAFAELLSPEELEFMLQIEERSGVRTLLESHIAEVKLSSAFMDANAQTTTLQQAVLSGKMVNINAADGGYFVNNAQVIEADLRTKNGVIHLIDAMIVVD